MNYLSLFTGAGGGDLAMQRLLGFKCVGYVEYENYCQKLIKQRISDGLLDAAPIFGDIRKFNSENYAESYQGLVDVVSGGFPCQPFSSAGKGLCENDTRNMWPDAARAISVIKPKHVLLENVPGVSRYLPVVIRDLRRAGYTVRRPKIIAAASLGAGHLRRRVWIYAHLDQAGFEEFAGEPATKKETNLRRSAGLGDCEAIPADSDGKRELQSQGGFQEQRGRLGYCSWWATEPDVVRVVYGLPNGMDRIAALGNGQVPICAAAAFKILSGVA